VSVVEVGVVVVDHRPQLAPGGVLLIVLPLALSFGLLALPMAIVGVLEIFVVVEVGLEIRLVDLIIARAMTCRLAGVTQLGSEGQVSFLRH
jgi:hypothetical protein